MTADEAIKVNGLGKAYRIGARQKPHDTLRDAVVDMASSRFKRLTGRGLLKDSEDVIWALKDVSFEVKSGEVLGVIGRNGAGKSTLLKILSRITAPTMGSVTLRGRVGSLLEVGTGFHPELTGRENIYLNGAILGMTRVEINSKFDEILDFAGIEKFIDTPVKRYSSGMYVRLAFAVAAHLEPEILLVDEVLAVGDAAFQKRCLGKMSSVTREGRTVLFVSHNMAAIESLCHRAVLIDNGEVKEMGDAGEVVRAYLSKTVTEAGQGESGVWDLSGLERPAGLRPVLKRLTITDGEGRPTGVARSGAPVCFNIHYEDPDGEIKWPIFGVRVLDVRGQPLFFLQTRIQSDLEVDSVAARGMAGCRVERLPLMPGKYLLTIGHGACNTQVDLLHEAAVFMVEAGDFYGTGRLPPGENFGPMLVDCDWSWHDLEGGAVPQDEEAG